MQKKEGGRRKNICNQILQGNAKQGKERQRKAKQGTEQRERQDKMSISDIHLQKTMHRFDF